MRHHALQRMLCKPLTGVITTRTDQHRLLQQRHAICLMPPLLRCVSQLTTKSVVVVMQIRAAVKRENAGKYATKVKARSKRKQHVAAHQTPRNELAGVFRDT